MTEEKELKIFSEVLGIVERPHISTIQIAKECLELIKQEIKKPNVSR